MGRSSLGPAEDAPDSLEVGGKTSEQLKPNRVATSRSVWDQIRIDYETSRETIAQIARRFGVSRGAISHRSRTEGWLPRRTRSRAPGDGQQDVLIRRLYRTIDRKLAQLEMRMSNDEDNLSIADHERETRALGQLIRNFEKVSGLETEQSGGAGTKPGGKSDQEFAELPNDPESLRNELAERILRLREKRSGGKAGDP